MKKATNWEFTNRAMVFGLIFGVSSSLYSFDHQNATAVLANWLGPRLQLDPDSIARLLFAFASFLLVLCALIRTWAASYLRAGVVYSSQVRTESLVADGPFRYLRNPLYLGNVLMAFGIGAMMSRAGLVLVVLGVWAFCYRLILREESELLSTQGAAYAVYSKAVPRLWPALVPRVASAGRQAMWAEGFKAEAWCWGFAAAVLAFAITLKIWLYFAILGGSLALFWVSSTVLGKKANPQA